MSENNKDEDFFPDALTGSVSEIVAEQPEPAQKKQFNDNDDQGSKTMESPIQQKKMSVTVKIAIGAGVAVAVFGGVFALSMKHTSNLGSNNMGNMGDEQSFQTVHPKNQNNFDSNRQPMNTQQPFAQPQAQQMTPPAAGVPVQQTNAAMQPQMQAGTQPGQFLQQTNQIPVQQGQTPAQQSQISAQPVQTQILTQPGQLPTQTQTQPQIQPPVAQPPIQPIDTGPTIDSVNQSLNQINQSFGKTQEIMSQLEQQLNQEVDQLKLVNNQIKVLSKNRAKAQEMAAPDKEAVSTKEAVRYGAVTHTHPRHK